MTWKITKSYLPWHWRVMKNLKKNWLMVWKMTWGMWQILTRALESLKMGTMMGSFNLKKKMYEVKNYRGVMCHDNEEWCKIWGKIDMKNFASFGPSTWKSKKFQFNELLLSKVYIVWAKKAQRSYLSSHCRVMQNF